MRPVLLAAALLVATAEATGFYLPGISPRQHRAGEEFYATVNSLRSLSRHVPYDYYKAPFCKPQTIVQLSESLGEVIMGDRRQSSLYSFKMLENASCMLLPCAAGSSDLVRSQLDEFERMINDGYRAGMSIDNLPVYNPGYPILGGLCTGEVPLQQTYPYQRGYALGVHKACLGATLINNHLDITIQYHTVEIAGETMHRVVGLDAVPFSVKHNPDGGDCNALFRANSPDIKYLKVDDMKDPNQKVWWSYGVTFIENKQVTWSTRWDAYLNTSVADSAARVHWVPIILILLIALALGSLALGNLVRALRLDFMRYNITNAEDLQEEFGWKLVHADVFRAPDHPRLFSVLVGTGAHLTAMTLAVLAFALLGLLSPASRGLFMTISILAYVILSISAGYVTGKMLMMFNLKEWRAIFLNGLVLPGVAFVAFLFIDILDWRAGASDAVPFTTILALFGLWVCFSVPLTVIGASYAFHQPAIEPAVKIGRLAREIPEQRYYHTSPFIYLIPALVPMIAISSEMQYIFASMWQGIVYYAFGFLTVVFLLWAFLCVLSSLVVVYNMLCYENHRWWWASFIVPGGAGLHMLVYSTFYFFTASNITGFIGTAIYFVFVTFLSIAYGLVAGTLGFAGAFVFTRVIYSSIKLD